MTDKMTDDLNETVVQSSRLRNTPSWLIMQTATVTNRFVTAAYSNVAATRHQYSVLSALNEITSATQAELGRHCNIDRSDIAGTIAELEAAGHIIRQENPADRRQNIVTITNAGMARLQIIADALTRAQDELLDGMNMADRNTLSALLVRILETHRAAPPERSIQGSDSETVH